MYSLQMENTLKHENPATMEAAKLEPRKTVRKPWFAVFCLLGVAFVQWIAPDFDHQFANIISAVFLLVAAIGITLWWWAKWSDRPVLRWGPLLACLLVVTCGLILFRPVGVNGELIPIFEYRWVEKGSLVVEKTREGLEGDSIELSSELTSSGFNGFYASQLERQGEVQERQFLKDWESQQPEVVWRQSVGGGLAGISIVQVAGAGEPKGNDWLGDYRILTLEQREQEEWLTCYDLASGELLWHYGEPGSHYHPMGDLGPRTTPIVDPMGRVVAVTATGKVWAVDGKDGKLIWRVDLLELGGTNQEEFEKSVSWGRSGSPLLVDEKVIVPLGGSPGEARKVRSLAALSMNDGAVIWTGGDEQISYASPILAELAGEPQIVTVNEASVSGHSIESGEVLWRHPWDGQSNGAASCSNPLVIDSDSLLLSKGYRQGAERVRVVRDNDVLKVATQWKNHRVMRTKLTNAVKRQGFAYGLNDGALECIDLETGESLWKQGRVGRFGQGQVLLIDDVLLVSSEDGELALVAAEPDTYRELARMPVINGRTWNLPAFIRNIVVLRNTREMAVVRLPSQ